MKNVFLVVLTFISSMIFSQAYTGKGDMKVNAGLSGYGNGTGITGTFDYGLSDLFSLGAGTEIYFDNNDNDKDNNNLYLFGRSQLHMGEILGMNENVDLYPGVNLGLYNEEFNLGAYIGFRYFFNERIGAYVELGNHGSLGVSLNF